MKKIKKIKIKLNGKIRLIDNNLRLQTLIANLKIPIKKVAIELNQEILDKITLHNLIKKMKLPINKVAIELNQKIVNKKSINKIIIKKNDKIEIVHFIGGG